MEICIWFGGGDEIGLQGLSLVSSLATELGLDLAVAMATDSWTSSLATLSWCGWIGGLYEMLDS